VFDIIFCRNVLIYFDQNTKTNIFERLSRMLEPDGVLALGAAESVVGITSTFKPYPERRGLYRPNIAPVIRVGASSLVPQTLRAVAAAS
jgi:chemotaxis protein methyltransferase CheR